MLKTQFLLASLFACSLLLIMGAINYQPASPLTATAKPDFLPQSAAFDSPLESPAADELLTRAIQALDPSNISWLNVTIWQKQACEGFSFEAESRLVRGPNHCARLTMTVNARHSPVNVVVVSDGVGLAHACTLPGKRTEVDCKRFINADESSMTAGDIEQLLVTHGCGGPHCLLKDVQAVLEEFQVVPGTWKNTPVYRLSGRVKTVAKNAANMPWTEQPRTCLVYLNAQTLWPHRLEWCADGTDPILQIEFRDPEINRALTDEQCAREFTYLPE